jgi:hypothetical protein
MVLVVNSQNITGQIPNIVCGNILSMICFFDTKTSFVIKYNESELYNKEMTEEYLVELKDKGWSVIFCNKTLKKQLEELDEFI